MIVWHTGHVFNETVTAAVHDGLRAAGVDSRHMHVSSYSGRPEPCVSYGMLRGNDRIYKDCIRAGIKWWNVDRGFFRPGHFEGYYRFAFRDIQVAFRRDATVEPSRWEALGMTIKPWRPRADGHVLVCPPSVPTAGFYGLASPEAWLNDLVRRLPPRLRDRVFVRWKGDERDRLGAILASRLVVVYNSALALESLLEGVPAIAERGIVRGWNGLTPERALEDATGFDRGPLMQFAAATQFTLAEIRSGEAWRAVRSLLS